MAFEPHSQLTNRVLVVLQFTPPCPLHVGQLLPRVVGGLLELITQRRDCLVELAHLRVLSAECLDLLTQRDDCVLHVPALALCDG